MRTRFLVLVAITAVALSPAPASAHDLRLVVKLPPDAPGVLVLETGFDDDTPAEEAKIVVTDASGAVVAEGKTDERGVCRLTRPGPGAYTATAEAYGHKDRVPFEIVGAAVEGEYRGWRPDRTTGLVVGVGGLLVGSGAYWWFRRHRM